MEPSIYPVYLMSEEEKKEESTPEVEGDEAEAVDEAEMEKEEEAPAKVDEPTPE